MVFAATVQVAHTHPHSNPAVHCKICFLIHAALPAETTVAHVSSNIWAGDPTWYIAEVPARYGTYSLRNRPPPLPLA